MKKSPDQAVRPTRRYRGWQTEQCLISKFFVTTISLKSSYLVIQTVNYMQPSSPRHIWPILPMTNKDDVLQPRNSRDSSILTDVLGRACAKKLFHLINKLTDQINQKTLSVLLLQSSLALQSLRQIKKKAILLITCIRSPVYVI